MYKRSRNLITCNIAGEQYYDYLEIASELRTGARLDLILESDNPYDPNAVALYYGDKKLGYIPQRNNVTISMLLSFGYDEILEAFYYLRIENHTPQVVVKLKDRTTT